MAERSMSFFQGIKYVPNMEELDQEKQPMKIDEKPANEKNTNDENLSFSDFCEFHRLSINQEKKCEIPFYWSYSETGSKESYAHRRNNDRLQSAVRRLAADDIHASHFRRSRLNAVAKLICDYCLSCPNDGQCIRHSSSWSHRSQKAILNFSNAYGHRIGLTRIAQYLQRVPHRIRIDSHCGIFIYHFCRIVWHFAVALCNSRGSNAKEGKTNSVYTPMTYIVFSCNFQFSDTKCRQFNLYDVVLGNGRICAANIPDGIRCVGNAQLHVLVCDILLLSLHIHTCRHSRNKRQIIWHNNASNGETKMM